MSVHQSVNTPGGKSGGPARRPGLILAFLCVAGFMTFLDVSIVNVALPTVEDELDISQTALPYVVTTYATILGGFLLLTGRLGDNLGRRKMLQTGLVLFAVTSLIAGLSQNAAMLILSRGGQGLGAAFMATSALSLLASNFEEGPERNKALGAWGALSGIAAVAGVMLGGLLTDGPGWRWIFFVNVPIGLIGALVAPALVGESKADSRRGSFDFAGTLALTAGLILLIFSLGQTVDDSSVPQARIYGGFALAAVLLVAFVFIERRAKAPLIPLGIFRRPSLRSANIIAILLIGTVVTLFFFASLFMQQVLEFTAIETGMAYVPLALLTGVGAGIASNVVTKVPAKIVLLVGLTLAGTGMVLLWRAPSDSSYWVDLLPAFALLGIGLGLSFVSLQISAFAGIKEEEAGVASGLINTSQEIGGALGLAVAATWAFRNIAEMEAKAASDPSLAAAARTDVFHDAFLVGATFAAAAFLVTLVLLPLTKSEPASEEPQAVGADAPTTS
ncbi:MFS transporter [Streptomyces sp. H27-C3]|uniref:MFS transporter n=1 Tax=Streptomyces sp. H27-C3 TaxID=3046305 RepID=UPI0024BBA79B|nr:MFS transporter [Streptomyces sp. H27-C3]MDJ0466268.1 MFS transporter [Streptomyces sp. H27-C3]